MKKNSVFRWVMFLVVGCCTKAESIPLPSIVRIANSALPSLDATPVTHLNARSMATIFGSNLSRTTAVTAPPWQSELAGVQVHIVIGAYTPCAASTPPAGLVCEIAADLIYVSPNQINFVVPDLSATAYAQN